MFRVSERKFSRCQLKPGRGCIFTGKMNNIKSTKLIYKCLCRCIVPDVTIENPVLQFQNVFLARAYEQAVELTNDTHLPACYGLLPQVILSTKQKHIVENISVYVFCCMIHMCMLLFFSVAVWGGLLSFIFKWSSARGCSAPQHSTDSISYCGQGGGQHAANSAYCYTRQSRCIIGKSVPCYIL